MTMGAQNSNDFAAWTPDAIIINLGTNDAGAMGNLPWHGPDGQVFQQISDPGGLARFENAAIDFLKELRRYNPASKLVWVYGMLGDPLRPQLERAVEQFRLETGDRSAYYLPLPAVTEETMGSRQHPGYLCHQAAAEVTAEFLRSIL